MCANEPLTRKAKELGKDETGGRANEQAVDSPPPRFKLTAFHAFQNNTLSNKTMLMRVVMAILLQVVFLVVDDGADAAFRVRESGP